MESRIIHKFRAEYSDDFSMDFIRGIFKVYKDSYDDLKEQYPLQIMKDHIPYRRKSDIDNLMVKLAKKYPSISSSLEPNMGNNCYHTELRTKSCHLTHSKLSYPTEQIRDAKFRNNLASYNIQYNLFEESVYDCSMDKLYFIITYGSDSNLVQQPDFINLIYPSSNNNTPIINVNLIKLLNLSYSDITSSAYFEPKSEVSIPPLRENKKAK